VTQSASWKSPDDEFMLISAHGCSTFSAKMLPSALIRLFIGLAMISAIQTSTKITLNQNGYSDILFAVSPDVPSSESERIIENIKVISFKFNQIEWSYGQWTKSTFKVEIETYQSGWCDTGDQQQTEQHSGNHQREGIDE